MRLLITIKYFRCGQDIVFHSISQSNNRPDCTDVSQCYTNSLTPYNSWQYLQFWYYELWKNCRPKSWLAWRGSKQGVAEMSCFLMKSKCFVLVQGECKSNLQIEKLFLSDDQISHLKQNVLIKSLFKSRFFCFWSIRTRSCSLLLGCDWF